MLFRYKYSRLLNSIFLLLLSFFAFPLPSYVPSLFSSLSCSNHNECIGLEKTYFNVLCYILRHLGYLITHFNCISYLAKQPIYMYKLISSTRVSDLRTQCTEYFIMFLMWHFGLYAVNTIG